MHAKFWSFPLVALTAISLLPAVPEQQRDGKMVPVTIEKTHDDKGEAVLKIAIEQVPFFSYQFHTGNINLPRPVIHPLFGPNGEVLTQLGEIPDKRTAHFWHTGMWISHQNFSGGNNWQIDADPHAKKLQYSRLVHQKFEKILVGNPAKFVEFLHWQNTGNTATLLKETRTVSIPKRPPEKRVIDFDLVFTAQGKDFTFNKTPYHLLAVRAVNSMVPALNKDAAITNSEGQQNPKDGAAAKWIDVSGPVNGKKVGITLFNHPNNFRHPTPCLNFGNQTIGLSPTHSESYTLKAGQSLHLRYRALVHAGMVGEAGVAQEYESYCKEAKGEKQ
jgi:hypothetical protein